MREINFRVRKKNIQFIYSMEKEVESTAVIYSNNEYRNNKISLLRKSHFYHLSSFFIVAKRRKFSAFFVCFCLEAFTSIRTFIFYYFLFD